MESVWSQGLAGSNPVPTAMKVIFLNVNRGSNLKKLLNFIKEHQQTTNIFCFQEANKNLIVELAQILKDFDFVDTSSVTDDPEKLQVCMIKKDHLQSSGTLDLYETTKIEPKGFVQYLIHSSPHLLVGNVHGKVYPGDKKDNKLRKLQSKRIIDFLMSQASPKIVGGDFNLLPETESIKMFKENGFRDLIQEYKIKTTRNESAWSFAKNNKDRKYFGKQVYADYVFVAPDIKVNSFEVPNIEISDHLPLILDCEI